MTADAFDDYRGVDVIAITNGNAIQAMFFTPDTTGIQLQLTVLDLNSGTLSITFDDFVDVDTLNDSGIASTVMWCHLASCYSSLMCPTYSGLLMASH